MTRKQERRVLLLMRMASVRLLRNIVDAGTVHVGPEAVMDELWTQKAALGEMLRRGEFDAIQEHHQPHRC